MRDSPRALELFISYSHQDDELRRKLETHIALLKRQSVFNVWHDRRISAGREWAGEIDEALERADVVLLLVSSDFLASDYCYDREMTRALRRHEEGAAHVVPVILRPCDWQSSLFGKLQGLPADGKPVTTYPSIDAAFTEVAVGLRALAKEIRGAPAVSPGSATQLPVEPPAMTAGASEGQGSTAIERWRHRIGQIQTKTGWRLQVVALAIAAVLGVSVAYYALILRPRLMDAQNALRRGDYRAAAQRMSAMPAWSNTLPFVARLAAQADFGDRLEQGTPIRNLTPTLDELSARYPAAPDVLVFQGLKAYYVDQDPEKARQRFKAAADLDAAHVEAHFLAVGRDLDLAYIALSQADVARAQSLTGDARQLIRRALKQSPYAEALPRYANQIGSLEELEGNDAAAYAVYENLLPVDPESALSGAFVSWRLSAANNAVMRTLEGLEQARGQVEKNARPAEGWLFRVQATELIDVRSSAEKLCLIGWAYDVTTALQRASSTEPASETESASSRTTCGTGAVAARSRQIVCVQVLNAQRALPESDVRQAVLGYWRTIHLRCGNDLQPLPVLAPRPPDPKHSARFIPRSTPPAGR
jgi:tetratricopeptide (TPR) repeat protein